MPDVTPIVFVVDDDVSVRESLELLISERRLATRNVRLGDRNSCPALARRSLLPRPRCHPARAQRLELQQQLAERTEMPISSSPVTATCR